MLIAVDNNVLLDLADGRGEVIEAIQVIRRKLPDTTLVVTPTVLMELAGPYGDDTAREQLSRIAMANLLNWQFQPVDFVPVDHGIVELIASKLRNASVIDEEERHDSFIIAEAALCGCKILISSDRLMINAINDHRETMWRVLEESDAANPKLTLQAPGLSPNTLTRLGDRRANWCYLAVKTSR